jgi:hypothetical protein
VDEIYSVLRTLQGEEQPPRAYEILQELRDISSMAMEYFDEKIVPGLLGPGGRKRPAGPEEGGGGKRGRLEGGQ